MTNPLKVATIDYEACKIIKDDNFIKVPFQKAGKCHGLLLWIDYEIAELQKDGQTNSKTSSILSTVNGRSCHQIIRMLPSPIEISPFVLDNDENASFSCKINIGNLDSKESHELEFSVDVE